MSPIQHHPSAANGIGALLVLAHGAGAGHQHPFMQGLARALAARGVHTVTFNFPYVDAGRRVPDRAPVLEACFRDVVEAARRMPGLGALRVFVGGKSMGGRMATHLAAEGLDVLRGAIAIGYPLHPPGRPGQLRASHLADIRVPLLVVQGERDAFGTPDELRPHLARVPGGATLHVVSGGDHSLASRGIGLDATLAAAADVMRDWIAAR